MNTLRKAGSKASKEDKEEKKEGRKVASGTSVSIRKQEQPNKSSKVPAGAKVMDRKVNIDTEKIENGYLVTKNTEIKYQMPGKEYSDWAYQTEKYYSAEDPLTISLSDESLADAFE